MSYHSLARHSHLCSPPSDHTWRRVWCTLHPHTWTPMGRKRREARGRWGSLGGHGLAHRRPRRSHRHSHPSCHRGRQRTHSAGWRRHTHPACTWANLNSSKPQIRKSQLFQGKDVYVHHLNSVYIHHCKLNYDDLSSIMYCYQSTCWQQHPS